MPVVRAGTNEELRDESGITLADCTYTEVIVRLAK